MRGARWWCRRSMPASASGSSVSCCQVSDEAGLHAGVDQAAEQRPFQNLQKLQELQTFRRRLAVRLIDEAADVALIPDPRLEDDEERILAADHLHRGVEAVPVKQLLNVLGRDVREHAH